MKSPWYTKFKHKRAEFDGRSFASQFEASVYGLLKLQVGEGFIRDIECQVQVLLTDAKIIYKPDFRFFDLLRGEECYAEAKGFETPEWRIKLKLWRHYGPGPLRLYKGNAARPKLVEEIVPYR